MATQIIALVRAAQHPLFSDLLSMELAGRLRQPDLATVHHAVKLALEATAEGLADADPSELEISDEEFEQLV